jgi:hypothetical protein
MLLIDPFDRQDYLQWYGISRSFVFQLELRLAQSDMEMHFFFMLPCATILCY